MTMYLRLLRVQFNQRFGLSVLRASFAENPGRTLLRGSVVVIAALGIAMLIGLYAWLLWVLFPAFETLGMQSLLLGIALLAAMVIVCFMGMIYLIGVLFFAKDTAFLAALPIPQQTVFAAKFSQVFIGELGVTLALLLPPFIVYGIQSGAGVAYWLRAVLVAVLAPCIPLAIASLLSLLLMRLTALWRRREVLTTVGSIVLVVGIILGQSLLASRMPEDLNAAAILALISDSSGLLRRLVSFFPPSAWAAEGLLGHGGMLLLYTGVSMAALACVVWLAGRLYYRGAMAQTESTGGRVRAVKLSGKAVRAHGAVFALFQREWRTVLRSPTYALNGLIVIIVGPLLLLLPKLMQGVGDGKELDMLFAVLEQAVDGRLIMLLLAAIFCFIGQINPAVTTTMSREGQLYYLARYLPVSPAKQAWGKYLFGVSIAALAMVLMAASAVFVLGFGAGYVAAALGIGLLATLAPLALSMIPDVVRPKLAWNSETEAIKQNVSAMVGMLIGWAYVLAAGAGCFLLMRAGVSLSVIVAVVLAGSAVLFAASMWLLIALMRRTLRRIEG